MPGSDPQALERGPPGGGAGCVPDGTVHLTALELDAPSPAGDRPIGWIVSDRRAQPATSEQADEAAPRHLMAVAPLQLIVKPGPAGSGLGASPGLAEPEQGERKGCAQW